MRHLIIMISSILIINSCGGGQSIQKPMADNNTKQEEIKSVNDKEEKTNSSSNDDELLQLLEGKKDATPEKQEMKSNSQDLGVSFEPLKKDSIKEKPAKEVQAEQQTTNDSAVKELSKLDDRVKSLSENLDKKPTEKKIEKKVEQKPVTKSLNEAKKESVKSPVKTVSKSNGSYESDYQDAYNIFQTRNYAEAIRLFQTLVDKNPKHQLADNAQYWIGESNFAKQNYRQAILDFEKVLTFPKSNKNEDSQFKIAYCYVLLKDKSNAQIELQRFINKYPKSRNLNRAKKMLSNL